MIKSELIANLCSRLPHLSERDVVYSVNLILSHMGDHLGENGRIEIRGFGSFCLHHRPPRNAHNPKTGEKVVTVAKYSPHFKPGKALREAVNASKSWPIRDAQEGDSDEDEGGRVAGGAGF